MWESRCGGNRRGLAHAEEALGMHEGTAPGAATAAAPWTGRLVFDLYTRRGWLAGTVELVVRRDIVEVWTRRQLGLFDRDVLRRWLRHHTTPLVDEDVTWTLVRSQFAVQLAGSAPYSVPDDVTAILLRQL
jgi:hypothetical protein